MQQVEIRVKGQIDERWAEWLEGLTITHTTEGETVLSGSALDQAALYGLIGRLRDLGLTLLSVNPREANAESLQVSNTDSGWKGGGGTVGGTVPRNKEEVRNVGSFRRPTGNCGGRVDSEDRVRAGPVHRAADRGNPDGS